MTAEPKWVAFSSGAGNGVSPSAKTVRRDPQEDSRSYPCHTRPAPGITGARLFQFERRLMIMGVGGE